MKDRQLLSPPAKLILVGVSESPEPSDDEIQPGDDADNDRDKYDLTDLACTD